MTATELLQHQSLVEAAVEDQCPSPVMDMVHPRDQSLEEDKHPDLVEPDLRDPPTDHLTMVVVEAVSSEDSQSYPSCPSSPNLILEDFLAN